MLVVYLLCEDMDVVVEAARVFGNLSQLPAVRALLHSQRCMYPSYCYPCTTVCVLRRCLRYAVHHRFQLRHFLCASLVRILLFDWLIDVM